MTARSAATQLTDGRRVNVEWEGPLGKWVVRERDGPGVLGRAPTLRKAPWDATAETERDAEAIGSLATSIEAVRTSAGLRIPCACCDRLTIEPPRGSYRICPVCGWEDDPSGVAQPEEVSGPNYIALTSARRNYREFGAKVRDRVRYVRQPRADERIVSGGSA